MKRVKLVVLGAALLIGPASGARSQDIFQRTFPSFSVALRQIDDTGYYYFHVSWNDGVVSDFRVVLDNAREDAKDIGIVAFGSSRLAFLNSHADALSVVDPRTGEPLDDLRLAGARISPDGRFIACRNIIGRGDSDHGNVYFIYDLALTPSQNRMGRFAESTQGLSSFAPGWAIYPSENRNEHTYGSMVSDPELRHRPVSGFFWLNSHLLAFVDYSSGQARVVTATLGEGAHEFAVQDRIIDPASVLDYSRLETGKPPAAAISVTWIELIQESGQTRLRLTFPSDNLKFKQWSLDVPF